MSEDDDRKPRDGERGRGDARSNDRGPRRDGDSRPARDGDRKPYSGDRPRAGGSDRPRTGGGERRPFTSDRPQRDGERKPYNSDRPRRDGDSRPARDGERKPDSGGGDRPRTGGGDRPRFSADRPQRDGDRKPYNSDRPRRDGDSRPARDGERKPYSGGGDRPRTGGGERRPFTSDRPQRDGDRKPYSSDRPRRDNDSRPPRDGERKPYSSDRPRRDGDSRPARDGERKPYSGGGDRPRAGGGERRPFSGERTYRGGRPDRGSQGGDRLWTRDGAPARNDRSAYDREVELTEEERLARELRSVRPHHDDPEIPDDVKANELDRAARNELKTLSKENAEGVAQHLVMAVRLLETDPELAHRHVVSAARRAGRIAIVRETLAITAYATGDFALALRELRTYRRISGSNDQIALMVDSERGVGRPDRALELGRSVERSSLPAGVQVSLAIAMSGARLDLGQTDAALAELEIAQLDPERAFTYSPELFAAYAEVLEELGRDDEAELWRDRADLAQDALDEAAGTGDDETIEIYEEEGEEPESIDEEGIDLTPETSGVPLDEFADEAETLAALEEPTDEAELEDDAQAETTVDAVAETRTDTDGAEEAPSEPAVPKQEED